MKSAVSPLRVSGWNEEQRFRRIEQIISDHIERSGHKIYEGYHRMYYDDPNLTETFVLWSDSALTVMRYREITQYNAVDVNKIDWKKVEFYSTAGKIYRRLLFNNYTYLTDGTDRGSGMDVKIIDYD